jgi:endonuclease YncB( thermonuclease family)
MRLAVGIVLSLACALALAAPTSAEIIGGVEQTGMVIGVYSGDTIAVRLPLSGGGQYVAAVHYMGVDAPEVNNPYVVDECYGAAALARNAELVMGKQVRLVRGPAYQSANGTLPRLVYVGNQSIGEQLVLDGAATVVFHGYEGDRTGNPSDPLNQEQQVRPLRDQGISPLVDPALNGNYLFLQEQARAANRGLWGACPG